MQELADTVWRDRRFHVLADRVQRAWVAREVGVSLVDVPPPDELTRLMQAAAILACSADLEHRQAAFRAATSSYELGGGAELPLDQALRVVLGRLGNFPSMRTRSEVALARRDLPVSLVAEELSAVERRTVRLGGGSAILTDFQHDLWTRLKRGRRLAVTAPTSAGKSYVLQNFLVSLFEKPEPRSVLYLVPTRALITQVSSALQADLAAVGVAGSLAPQIATVPVEATLRLPSRAIYVLTQERAQVMLAGHPRFAPDVIVVDEAHGIAEGARGVRLHAALQDLLARNAAAQVLFATPGVRNLDVFGRLLGLENVDPVRSREPTVAQNFVIVRVVDPAVGNLSLRMASDHGDVPPLAEVALSRRTVSRIEKLANISFGLGGGASNLVYANGPADAEAVALMLAERFRDREITSGRAELARVAGESVHPDYVLVRCVRVGVAFHYSNMPTQLRIAIERAVAAGEVDFLVCTSTLLQGVNLPVRNIFMFRPEKGQHSPLQGVDFWNLAGRAGRLLREFQGNIFLIDYEAWRRHPLEQAMDAAIVPAIDEGVLRKGRLLRVIKRPPGPVPDEPDLEAVFVRLLGDLRDGSLGETLGRISQDHSLDKEHTSAIAAAIAEAAEVVTLPQHVLRRSPDISAHKQQMLYHLLRRRASQSQAAAAALIPKRPGDPGAYESYAAALHACRRILLGLPKRSKRHRFLALVALWWMEGRPLPRIVQNQLDRNRDKDPRLVVRLTLDMVERDVRYQCVRLFGCFNAVLAQVLTDLELGELAARMPEVPLYLELGAADRTTISLMSVGISRPTATRLSFNAPSRGMDVAQALAWLSSEPAALARLPPTGLEEVKAVLTSGMVLR